MDFVVIIQLLKQSQPILKSGYLAFILSFLLLCLHTKITMILSIISLSIFVLLILQHYLYSRIQFDLGLLSYIATHGHDPSETQTLTTQLDQSLVALKLLPTQKAHREWSLRFQGCLKLLKIQGFVVLLQYIVLFILLNYSLKQSIYP